MALASVCMLRAVPNARIQTSWAALDGAGAASLRKSSMVRPMTVRHAALPIRSQGRRVIKPMAFTVPEHDDREFQTTAEKALEINVRTNAYGSLAEIGAGQEVSRWLFRVGGAAGTVARSISAYDKTVSDTIYGEAKRFVTNERLEAMLEVEYNTCVQALDEVRGAESRFFSFADTVTAKAFGRDNDCHGWMGIKFQLQPRSEPIKIFIHTRMKDKTFPSQQQAIGILGVNFLYGAVNWDGDLDKFLKGLMDDLSLDRIEVDSVLFQGPQVEDIDPVLVGLRLVKYGLATAAMFDNSGHPNVAQDTLYKKNVVLLRGQFRPFTNLHNDMVISATEQYFAEQGEECELDWNIMSQTIHENVVGGSFDECVRRDDTLVLLEMSIHDLKQCPIGNRNCEAAVEDSFVRRLQALGTMGYSVMVTAKRRPFKIGEYLRRHTKGDIVYCLGIPALRQILKESTYSDLDGGILESFGRLFKLGSYIYVYPARENGKLVTANNLQVDPEVQTLYNYLCERGLIRPILMYKEDTVTEAEYDIQVDDLIHKGDVQWERLVPVHVAQQIKSMHLKSFDVEDTEVDA